MSDIDGKLLAGAWVHVHEEDGPKTQVFRRADADLPPSRGRTELDIAEDLTAVRRGPGATDKIQGMGKVQLLPAGVARPANLPSLKIIDFALDRLVLDKD